jgi:hypothetical protein
MFGLLFNPADGADMLLRDIGWVSTDYTALYLRIKPFVMTAVRT